MRRLNDNGAVAVIVAVLAVVLFGFAALVIDVGALYAERRELQNGADAGALAIAQTCGRGVCGDPVATATDLGRKNASDGAARIPAGGVCGKLTHIPGTPVPATPQSLPSCAPTDKPSPEPDNYVRVTDRTDGAHGNLLSPHLARVLPGVGGTDVGASATVTWGVPSSVDSGLSITFSQCEYDKLTKNPVTGLPTFSPPYTAALERTIYFHTTDEATDCPAGPSGADLPGGFGWLTNDGDCNALVVNGWVDNKTGVSATADCKLALTRMLGKTIFIPVYTETNGLTGTNLKYKVTRTVGFVLTGWQFPGFGQPSTYRTGGNNPCKNSETCLSGFFVEGMAAGGTVSSGGVYQGVLVSQLIN